MHSGWYGTVNMSGSASRWPQAVIPKALLISVDSFHSIRNARIFLSISDLHIAWSRWENNDLINITVQKNASVIKRRDTSSRIISAGSHSRKPYLDIGVGVGKAVWKRGVCLRHKQTIPSKHNKHDMTFPAGTTYIPDTRLRPKQMGGLFAWDARNEDRRISFLYTA
jgi:hypothetical protein